MQEAKYLRFLSNKKEVVVNTGTILYVTTGNAATEIHTVGGNVYKTRRKLTDIEKELGNYFIKIHRGCLVSAMSIHEVTDKVYLNNGEAMIYTLRKKKEILDRLHEIQKNVIADLHRSATPQSNAAYQKHYRSFDNMPFAFTDIELIFNDETHAVDWIFRYGNQALANLERVSLKKLIGHSFRSVFPNMDSKWLRAYERATLYGETLEIIDYSPEIDTNLKVICFPTFQGHCGCILFNIADIQFIKNSNDAEKALLLYFGQMFHS